MLVFIIITRINTQLTTYPGVTVTASNFYCNIFADAKVGECNAYSLPQLT